jgi:hypothetical protein
MGFFQERLDDQNVIGDPDDVSIGRYNQRETYLDGDLGVAYSGSKLSLQGSLPNLKRFFKQDEQENTVDRSVFFASAGYKLLLESKENGFNIEPKACFRGVKGYDNILDLGCSMNIEDNRIQLFGMYHTSRSATYGMGFQYKSMAFSGIYTTETSVLRGYTEGSFEVNLRLQF